MESGRAGNSDEVWHPPQPVARHSESEGNALAVFDGRHAHAVRRNVLLFAVLAEELDSYAAGGSCMQVRGSTECRTRLDIDFSQTSWGGDLASPSPRPRQRAATGVPERAVTSCLHWCDQS
jgi:hypothetical protein